MIAYDICLCCPSHFFSFFSFFNKFIYLFVCLFIFGCVGSSLLCAGFLQLRRAEATLRCSARASHCGGLSRSRARALGARAQQLWHVGSRAQAQQLWRTGPLAPRHVESLEPVTPALAGRLPTTVPPGKSYCPSLFIAGAFPVPTGPQQGTWEHKEPSLPLHR